MLDFPVVPDADGAIVPQIEKQWKSNDEENDEKEIVSIVPSNGPKLFLGFRRALSIT